MCKGTWESAVNCAKSVAHKLWSLHPQQGTALMNTRADLETTKPILGAAAEVSSHIILYCWKWKKNKIKINWWPARSGSTKCDYIKNRGLGVWGGRGGGRGFNFRRSVSREQIGPCGCQRLGEESVNHGTQPTSPELQLRLFERSLNWNTVDVREKVNDFVRRPHEDAEQVLCIWQI